METADFLEELNESQRRAVEYCDGAELVIAGAGSGKTRMLTYKIAYLLRAGVRAWEILALTFTNKAAAEMKQRIAALVGDDLARHLYMGTFHSIFARLLRVEGEHLGYSGAFTIYDESDSRSLLKTIIKELQLDEKIYRPAAVHGRISRAKNNLVLPREYAADRSLRERDSQQRMPAMAAIYATYCSRCKKANAMDFDDLLVNTYTLFQDYDDVRRRYADKFQYILVDEYQDTNSVQQKIVWQLSKERQRVCAVGDDAQSIYAFRGANIDNILEFQNLYTNTQLFKLERNYRSTQRIVQAANSLIRHNKRQIQKDVYSRNDEGERLRLMPTYSDREEAIVVCNELQRIRRQDHCHYADMAILSRTNAQSRSFEEAMLKQGIPYRIYGGMAFYQRKEIKDIMAYLRLVVNPDDEEAFKRTVNYPKRGIGDTTVAKIAAAATDRGRSLWAVTEQPTHGPLVLPSATARRLIDFHELIDSFREKADTADAYALGVDLVKRSGISADVYADKSPESVSRQEIVEELLNSMQEFVASRREEGREDAVGIRDFLQEVSLQTDLDSNDDGSDDRVSLKTVHSTKVLDFQTVCIVGLEENIFPSSMAVGSSRELEEERRLLYVAITRAMKHCTMTYTKNRYRYGHMEIQQPSRFIEEIDRQLIEVVGNGHMDGAGITSFGGLDTGVSKGLSSTGFGGYNNNGMGGTSNRWQNSRPVASQFRADPKPRLVEHKDDPPISDTFSPSFRRLIKPTAQPAEQRQPLNAQSTLNTRNTAAGNMGNTAAGNTSTAASNISNAAASNTSNATRPGGAGLNSSLSVGTIIEHERFGIGRVLRMEGSGESTKAQVEFRNVGTKVLLLKFARFKVVD